MLPDILIYGGFTLGFLLWGVVMVVIFSLLQLAQRADARDQELFKHWRNASKPGARPEKSPKIFGAQVELNGPTPGQVHANECKG